VDNGSPFVDAWLLRGCAVFGIRLIHSRPGKPEGRRQGRSAGMRVLTVAGCESEQNLAFAGLHQLLRPVLDRVPELPERQAKALLGAFALSPDPVPPDALLTGIAVLTLLSELTGEGPLLVVADDAQWLDRGSLDTLAFAARRLGSEPLVLLLAARGTVPPAGFERDFAELTLAPLSFQDANRLLDAQPDPPRGRAREQVLAQTAGNPMALIELARVTAADPAAGRRWADEILPPSDRLIGILAAQFRALPSATREVLLLAAVADSPDLSASVPGLTADALAPAETAHLARWVAPGHSSTIRSSARRCTTLSRSVSARGPTSGSRKRSAAYPTAMPGTWPPLRWHRTSAWLHCWNPRPPTRSAEAVRPRPRGPWSAPRS
jgi:hypothetical protein